MRTEKEIEESLSGFERMSLDALRGLEKAKEMNSEVLKKHFHEWYLKCKAREQILKWVLCLPYLEDDKISLNSNEPGAVSSHEAEKVVCECVYEYNDDHHPLLVHECETCRKNREDNEDTE